jgi:hypothetical protein
MRFIPLAAGISQVPYAGSRVSFTSRGQDNGLPWLEVAGDLDIFAVSQAQLDGHLSRTLPCFQHLHARLVPVALNALGWNGEPVGEHAQCNPGLDHLPGGGRAAVNGKHAPAPVVELVKVPVTACTWLIPPDENARSELG